ALLVLEVLEEDLDFISGAGEFLEFVQGHGALGLEADIEDDGAFGDAEDLRLDDLALDDLGHGPFVHREHLLVFALAVVFVVQVGPDLEARGGGVQGGRGDGGTVGAHSGTSTWPRRRWPRADGGIPAGGGAGLGSRSKYHAWSYGGKRVVRAGLVPARGGLNCNWASGRHYRVVAPGGGRTGTGGPPRGAPPGTPPRQRRPNQPPHPPTAQSHN